MDFPSRFSATHIHFEMTNRGDTHAASNFASAR
jgi:hypothetical protein